MINSIFLTATATRGMGTSAFIWILMVVIYCAIVLIKDPKFFKNRKNVIVGACVGLGLATFVSITIRPFPAAFQSVVMIILMIAVLVILVVKESKKKPKQTNIEAKHELGRVEKLTKLKELLDAGAITQEEFDEKKNELLNL